MGSETWVYWFYILRIILNVSGWVKEIMKYWQTCGNIVVIFNSVMSYHKQKVVIENVKANIRKPSK